MKFSKVGLQVVVPAPEDAIVSEVVREFMLSLSYCDEWREIVNETFTPVFSEGSKYDNETKYTVTKAGYPDLVLTVNVIKLPSSDLLLVLSEHKEGRR